MTAARLAVAITIVLAFTACESPENGSTTVDRETATVMPAVVGRKLDVALDDIRRAGFDDDVDVIGGGTFGVIKKSNWTVCDQSPAAGQTVTAKPELKVDRSCDGNATESTVPPATTEARPSPPPMAPTTTSTAPTSEVATPAAACQSRPPASEELIVRETDPATTSFAYAIGGGWTWAFDTHECITGIQMALRTVPPIDGYCIDVAPKSANPGYDIGAEPAAPLQGVIGTAGGC